MPDGYVNDKVLKNSSLERQFVNSEGDVARSRHSSEETDTPRSSTSSWTSTTSESGRKAEIKRDLAPRSFVATLTDNPTDLHARIEPVEYVDEYGRKDRPEAYRKLSGHKVYVVSSEKGDQLSNEEDSPMEHKAILSPQIFNFSPALSQSSGHEHSAERRPSAMYNLSKTEPMVTFKTGEKLSFQFSFDPKDSSKIGVANVSTVTAAKSTSNHSTHSDHTARQPVAFQSQRDESSVFAFERRPSNSSSSNLEHTKAMTYQVEENGTDESTPPESPQAYTLMESTTHPNETVFSAVQLQMGSKSNNTPRHRRVSYVLATDGNENTQSSSLVDSYAPPGQQPVFVHLEPMDLTPEEGNEADNEEEQVNYL